MAVGVGENGRNRGHQQSVTLLSIGKTGKRSTRGPGRPRDAAASASANLNGILAAAKNSERERTQMRAALERIQAVVADALA